MLVWLQFFCFACAGALYTVLFGMAFTVAAGFGVSLLGLYACALVLGGYGSGLSLFYPRSAAWIGIVTGTPLMVYFSLMLAVDGSGFFPWFAFVPSVVSVGVGLATLRSRPTGPWFADSEWATRIAIGIVVAVTAVPATALLVRLVSFLLVALFN